MSDFWAYMKKGELPEGFYPYQFCFALKTGFLTEESDMVGRQNRRPERLWRDLGTSFWLVLYMAARVTSVQGDFGVVEHNRPLRDADIASQFGCSTQAVMDWRKRLRGRRLIHAQLADRRTNGFHYQVNLDGLHALGLEVLP